MRCNLINADENLFQVAYFKQFIWNIEIRISEQRQFPIAFTVFIKYFGFLAKIGCKELFRLIPISVRN